MTRLLQRILLLLIVILISQTDSHTQDVKIYESERYVVNSIVVISNQENWKSLSVKIEQDYPESEEYSFFLFNGSKLSNDSIKNFLNDYLNKVGLSKNYFHLLVQGDRDFIKSKNVFNPDIFASVSSMLKDPSSQYKDLKTDQDLSFDEILKRTNNIYTWDYVIRDIQLKNELLIHQKVGSTKLSLSYRPTVLFSNYDSYNPGYINAYSIGLSRKTKSRFSVFGELGLSIKRPKPQDDAQSLVLGQVDIESIINGEAGEEEIELNLSITGHIYTKVGFGIGYEFLSKKKTSLTFNTGINTTSFIGIEQNIDTTLVIDFSGFSPGSSSGLDLNGFSPEDIQGDGIDFRDNLISTRSFPLSLDMEVKLSHRLLFSGQVSYDLDRNTFSGGNTFNQLSFGLGFKYSFKKPKEKYYEYVRFKKK